MKIRFIQLGIRPALIVGDVSNLKYFCKIFFTIMIFYILAKKMFFTYIKKSVKNSHTDKISIYN